MGWENLKTWVRLHTGIVANRKVHALPDSLFRAWVNFLALAGKDPTGALPSADEIAWEMRRPVAWVNQSIRLLEEKRFIDRGEDGLLRMHEWSEHQFEKTLSSSPLESSSAERVRRFRAKQKGVTSVTESVTRNALQSVTSVSCNALPSRARSVSVSGSVSGVTGGYGGITPEELEAAWERHRKHRRDEPFNLVASMVANMNGQFDVKKFRDRHPRYCGYWESAGWNFCSLTFLGWIEALMPEPPTPAKSAAEIELERVWAEV